MVRTAPLFSTKHETLLARATQLFTDRAELEGFWQETAENFYVERATFQVSDYGLGRDFAAGLQTSYPLIVARDLANNFSSMLRPPGQQWMEIKTNKPDTMIDGAGRQWLEFATKVQYNAMSDPIAKFQRATKEGDRDYSVFGQTVISVEFRRQKMALLYRCWHLRDVVWCENESGDIYYICRRWTPSATDLLRTFGPENCHPRVKEMVENNNGKQAWDKVNVRHVVIASTDYKVETPGLAPMPWVSLWIDVDHKWVMEEVPNPTKIYAIPRWQTMSGSQYAFSPAVTCGIGDARLLQAQAYTLLRAGQ